MSGARYTFRMRTFGILATLCALSLLAPGAVRAQALPGIGGLEPLQLKVTPAHPRPYDPVKVTLSSTLVTLSASEISFAVDGVPVAEEGRSASFTLGGPGSRTIVSVYVVSPEGTFERALAITPAEVVLIAEPISEVPPLYRGARLVAPEGKVRLIALSDLRAPGGAKLDSARLSYVWKTDERTLEEYSGLGKNVLPADAPVKYRDARVTVTVSSQDGSVVAQASELVSPADPIVRIYRNDPLLGILFNTALSGTLTLPNAEEGLRMAPYFFAAPPSLTWTLNGNTAGSDAGLTLRTTGSEQGTAAVRAAARAPGTVPQLAESSLTLQFGGGGGGLGIFGL